MGEVYIQAPLQVQGMVLRLRPRSARQMTALLPLPLNSIGLLCFSTYQWREMYCMLSFLFPSATPPRDSTNLLPQIVVSTPSRGALRAWQMALAVRPILTMTHGAGVVGRHADTAMIGDTAIPVCPQPLLNGIGWTDYDCGLWGILLNGWGVGWLH